MMLETRGRTSRLELGDLVGVREIEKTKGIMGFEEVRMRDQTEGISEVDFVGAEVESVEKFLLEPRRRALHPFPGLACSPDQGGVHCIHFG